MKKYTKKDYIYLGSMIVFLLLMVLFLTRKGHLYGSTMDWETQHFSIPEYFRTLFYSTHDLFPDFGFHLGAGQNIYYFAYYGLLSPIVLLSYFFPFIPMVDYMIASIILIIIFSLILCYHWLKTHGYSSTICMLVSFCFLCASPIIFHSHRHIMFMNYFPFLILGLIGMDQLYEKNKKFLLGFSCFLLVMTSYYYSIGGLCMIGIYGIYCYLNHNEKLIWKDFFKQVMTFIIPMLIGILASSILIIPSFLTILSGRAKGNVSITLKQLFYPKLDFSFLLYSPYSIGVTALGLIALFYSFFTQKKSKKILSFVLILFILFPIFNYILNGTLYIDAKALIPFLPLVLLLSAEFLKEAIEYKIPFKKLIVLVLFLLLIASIQFSYSVFMLYLDAILFLIFLYFYYKFKKTILLCIPIIVSCAVLSVSVNSHDEFTLKKSFKNDFEKMQTNAIKDVLKEDTEMYRMINLNNPYLTVNKVYDGNYYTTSIYSSLSSMKYNQFYFDTINNPIPHRTRVITTSNNNLLFNMFIGNRYIVSNHKPSLGYQLWKDGDVKIYKNDHVFPIGYVNRHLMSQKQFETLSYPDRVEALLKYIVVPDYKEQKLESSIESVQFDFSDVQQKNVDIKKQDDIYYVNSKKGGTLKLPFKEKLENKILFVRFKVLESLDCSIGDSYIVINGVKNKLTCASWKYHNQNYEFDYVLSEEEINSLSVSFSEGLFKIQDVEFYLLDYDQIKTLDQNIDAFHMDLEHTKGDQIIGEIDVQQDGYFTISVPYDTGFKILVDGKKQSYEMVNTAFIGFPIQKGNHKIEIEYQAPFKKKSMIFSGIGLLLLALLKYLDVRKK